MTTERYPLTSRESTIVCWAGRALTVLAIMTIVLIGTAALALTR
jgi:hypothetical protein